MSYTINPNAKNGWVRNAENTIDLSIQTDASSVYLENGRTLEQEVGKGTMVSNVVTIDSSMEKVVEGTYDGAYENCKMYGRTLVNLMTNCKDEYVVRYHDPSNPNHTVANISMMKPNTEYTLFYKAKYRTEGEGAGTSGVLYIATSIEQGFISTSQGLTTEYKQYVFKFTTSSTVDCFTFKSNGNYFAIKECVLIEGDHTNQDVSFFEGLCDAKMPILKNVGRNLFNPTNIFYGNGVLNSDGTILVEKWDVGETGWGVTQMNCASLPSGAYYVDILQNGEFIKGRNKIWVRNSNEEMLANVHNRTLFTINEPTTRIDLVIEGMHNQTLVDATYSIHIEKADELPQKDTPYEPYKTNILETSNDVVLRGLPNGVKDSYDCLTGEYVQRVGEIVFDGSNDENWFENNNFPHNGQIVYGIRVTNLNGGVPYPDGISDTLPFIRKGYESNKPSVSTYMKDIYVRINGSTKEDLKAYLSQNPITVQYELAEPIVTTIEPSTTPFAYENGHIILESGHKEQSLLPTLEYSTTINRTGQIQSIANTIQKQEKQITKLEQMLIQNIINLDYNNTLLTLKNEMEEML